MESFQPVRVRGAATDALRQILERIESGRLAEGDLLPSERILATQMGVSRPTVRAVLEQLTSAGLVRVSAGRGGGARLVSVWVPEDLEDPGTMLDHAPSAEIVFGLLEARRTLEPRVAQLAALRATGEQLGLMEESIELLRNGRQSAERAAQAETRFHRIMWHASGNPVLERTMIDMSSELNAVRRLVSHIPVDHASRVELHEATMAAIRAGNPTGIETEMGRHLDHFQEALESFFRQRAQRPLPGFLTSESESRPIN